MDSEPDFSRTDRLFLQAREKDPSERERFLDQACTGDAELRQKVESLLAHDDPNFLDLRASLIGQSIGRYQILSELGAGGMGEVYRALDRRLERDVAIKVLPAEFATDPARLARFQREAQMLAALNHPNIAVIHDIQEERGIRFLVMELVEGATLTARLKRGPLPVEDALRLLKQVAEALEAAHGKGILHRDLKPNNIQITSDGRAKVLDFGLAKVLEPEADQEDPSNSPTISHAHTAGGVILGTAAYMSPEQASGRFVDKRTDIWAFGCVLYETLTGQQTFTGGTIADIIGSVVKGEPEWSRLPAGTPRVVRSLLRQCLQKQAKHRLHEIADARIAIEEVLAEPDPIGPQTIPTVSFRHRLAGFAAFLIIGAVVGWLAVRTPPAVRDVTQLQLGVEPAAQLNGSIISVRPSRTAFALSPDGRWIVFSAVGRFSAVGASTPPRPQLYLRGLADREATPIPGTDGGIGPFFSPDGHWIGFFSDDQIKKVPISGGPPVVICDVTPGSTGLFGASWAEDNTIFFSDMGAGISKVAAGGGAPVTVTTSDSAKGEQHLLPQLIPGTKALIFTVVTPYQWNKAHVVLQLLDTGESRVLLQGADARYVPTGHLLYMNSGTLIAVPFTAQKLQLTGDPIALIEGVMQGMNYPNDDDETGAGQFVVSQSGTLAYVTGGVHPNLDGSLVWVDRTGDSRPVVTSAPVTSDFSPRLSPAETQIAIVRGGNSNGDVWIYDSRRGVPTRITFTGNNWPVIWSPQGNRLVFGSNRSGAYNLYAVNPVEGNPVERLTNSEYTQYPSSWTSKGNLITFVEYQPNNYKIWVLPMDKDRSPKLFLESKFPLAYPEISPDGRWMVYASTESGTSEVYVQPYPGPGEKHRISTEGGSRNQPIWASNGREILYRNDQKFFSVAINSFDPFRAEPPRLLFEARPNEYGNTDSVRGWDISRDGQQFLLVRNEESRDKPVTQIKIVLNWIEELKRRAPRE